MELLRKRLGMRPTDVRRVIKKAPEVLAPRADGTTAAEAVDVSVLFLLVKIILPLFEVIYRKRDGVVKGVSRVWSVVGGWVGVRAHRHFFFVGG